MIARGLQEFYQLIKPNTPIIAVDFGEKKIGIALSDPGQTIAMPLEVYSNSSADLKIKKILETASKYSASGIVMGLPVNMDGSDSDQTQRVLEFTKTLSEATDIMIFLQDERLTTKAAGNLLKSFGLTRKERNNNDDRIAASMILETVLDSLKRLRNLSSHY